MNNSSFIGLLQLCSDDIGHVAKTVNKMLPGGLAKALIGNRTELTPEEQAIVNPLHFATMQVNALGDQLNAAREELRALEEPDQ